MYHRVVVTGSAVYVVLAAGACGAFGHHTTPPGLVPTGSEWEAPAAGLRSRHYEIAEIDTIIGFVRGIRTWSDVSGTLADQLTVEIYRDGRTKQRIRRVMAQTRRVRHGPAGVVQDDLGATSPSGTVRRDAEELVTDLGCPLAQTAQRMTLGGPVFEAWCSEELGAAGAGRA